MARQKSPEEISNELYSQLVAQAKHLCQNAVLTYDNSIVDPVSDKRHLTMKWIFDNVDPSIMKNNRKRFRDRLPWNPRFSCVPPPKPGGTVGLMWGDVAEQMTTETETLREVHMILTGRSMPPSAIYLCLPDEVTLARLRSEEAVEAFVQTYPKEFSLDQSGLVSSIQAPLAKTARTKTPAAKVGKEKCHPGLDNTIANLLQQANPTHENSRTKRIYDGRNEGKLFFKIGWVLAKIPFPIKDPYIVTASKNSMIEYLKANPRFLVNQDCVHVADLSKDMPTEQALEREIVQLLEVNHGRMGTSNVVEMLSSNSKLRIRSVAQLTQFLQDKKDIFTLGEGNLILHEGVEPPSSGDTFDEVEDLDKHVTGTVKLLASFQMGISLRKFWSSMSQDSKGAFMSPQNMLRLINKPNQVSEISNGKLILCKSRFYTDEMTSNDLVSLLLRNPLSVENEVIFGNGTRMYRIDWVSKNVNISGFSASHIKSILSARSDLFTVYSDGVLLSQTFLESTKKRLQDILDLYKDLVKDSAELEFFPIEQAFSTNDDMFHTKKRMHLAFFLHYPNLFKLNEVKSGVRLATEEEGRQHVETAQKKSLKKPPIPRVAATAAATPSLVCRYLQHLSPNLVLLMQNKEGKVLCHRQSFTWEDKAEVSEEQFCQTLNTTLPVSVYRVELPAPLHDIRFIATHAWQGLKRASPILTDIHQTTLNEWRRFVAANVDVYMQKVDPGLGLLKVGVSPHFALSKSLRQLLGRVDDPLSSSEWTATDYTQFLVYPELFSLDVHGLSTAYDNPRFESVLFKLLLPSELKPPLEDCPGASSLPKSKCLRVEAVAAESGGGGGGGGGLVVRSLNGYIWQMDFEHRSGIIIIVVADTQYLVRFSIPAAEMIDSGMKEAKIGDWTLCDLVVTEGLNNVVRVAVNDLRTTPATPDHRRCFSMRRRGGNDESEDDGEGQVQDEETLVPLEEEDEEETLDLEAFTLPAGPEEEAAAAAAVEVASPTAPSKIGKKRAKDECSLS